MNSWFRTILCAFLAGLLIGLARLHRGHPAAIAVRGHALTTQLATSAHTNQVAEAPQRVPAAQLSETPVPESGEKSGQQTVVAMAGDESVAGLSPDLVLQNLRSVFRDYSARFGGNPIGTNLEITSRLNGGNRRHVVFLKSEDGMRLNAHGELVDNWGTPYFFHQLSNTEMEIHSAGPDRRMWTADDLVIK